VTASTPGGETRFAVLVDFDGTLAAADLGNRFFGRFARDAGLWRQLLDDWKAQRITARECLARECALAEVSESEADAFFDEHALDEEAPELLAAIAQAGGYVEIASDGLERYVRRLLTREGLAVPYTANGVAFTDSGLVPVFASEGPAIAMPGGRVATARAGATEGCGRCGNCKGARLRALRDALPGRTLYLVGDGYSDRCAAEEADVVYAKDELFEYCRQRGLAARPFTRLLDVARAEGWALPPAEAASARTAWPPGTGVPRA